MEVHILLVGPRVARPVQLVTLLVDWHLPVEHAQLVPTPVLVLLLVLLVPLAITHHLLLAAARPVLPEVTLRP